MRTRAVHLLLRTAVGAVLGGAVALVALWASPRTITRPNTRSVAG